MWTLLGKLGIWLLHRALDWAYNYIDQDGDGKISKQELAGIKGHIKEFSKKLK